MRVLFVSHSAEHYGAERSMLQLLEGCRAKGFEPLVLLPKRGPLSEELAKRDVLWAAVGHTRWICYAWEWPAAMPLHAAINWLAARRAVRPAGRFRPDVIYTNTLASPLGGMLARRLHVPNVWHAREFVREDFGARFEWGKRASLRFVDRTSARVVCNSQAVRESLAACIPAAKMQVVYNGIVSEAHSPPQRPPRTVLSAEPRLALIGAVTEHKGPRDAIEALGVLNEQGVRATLREVGTGSDAYVRRLKALASRLGVGEQIQWCGFVANVAEKVLAEVDMVVVCSRCEAFGRVAVEAMASGCPVVGTRAGGLPEILEDGVTGLLYPPGDVAALAAQIRRLMGEPDLHRRLAVNGIEMARNRFSVEKYVGRMVDVLREAAKAGTA